MCNHSGGLILCRRSGQSQSAGRKFTSRCFNATVLGVPKLVNEVT